MDLDNANGVWEELEKHILREKKKHPEWRAGQTIFNTAHKFFPIATDIIRGTKDDCFHNDAKIESFKNKFIELVSEYY